MEEYRGLSSAEVERSRREHGENTVPATRGNGFLRLFLSNFGDPVIKVLLAVLAVNLLFMFRRFDWFETVGIALSILLATLVSTLSEYGSENAFEKLREEAGAAVCRVCREGTVISVAASELVVGDILWLQSGERVPADAVLLKGTLRVDRSALNGESGEVSVGADGKLLCGYVICGGEGIARVTAVGAATQYGAMAGEVQEPPRESPLRVRLGRLAGQLSRVGTVAAVLVAAADLFHRLVMDNGFAPAAILSAVSTPSVLFEALLHALTLALSVVVVAVPEGLPLMVTVVLSSNMRRMLRDKVLIRKPVGIETAGSMTLLFTDKTGTLTCGHPAVTGFLTGDGKERTAAQLKRTPLWPTIRAACTVNTECALSNGRPLGGNATDRAVFGFCLPLERVEYADSRLPFDSVRKYSAARCGTVTYVKGAPEQLLPRCRTRYEIDGTVVELADARRADIYTYINTAASEGRRVLAVAATDTPVTAESGLPAMTLIGFCLIADPLRREAPDAVRTLREAGVRVVMLTGDGKETATAIARQAGILDGEGIVLSGAELEQMPDAEVCAILSRMAVLCRARPADKSRLVRLAQQCGAVVGMTGDGVNDAPALKKSDVGFAMGSGTEVAKEAGDVVILDDNIASITRAALYGRTVFHSIRKFLVFQLTMNFCAVGVSVIGPFIGVNTPVTVVQMLWVNIIMDTLAGLAFAGEPPLDEYMREPPKRRDEPILTREMATHVAAMAAFTVALCTAFLKLPLFDGWFRPAADQLYRMTGFFALFIFSGIFHSFSVRTSSLNPLRHLGGNRRFAWIMAGVAAVQMWMIYFGGAVFRTGGLTWGELRRTLLLALLVIPADMVYKLLRRRLEKS